MLWNQKEIRIKILRSDKDIEYFSREFSTFCEENKIIYQINAPLHHNIMDLLKRKIRP
jgi:hypothetical protein